MVKHLAGDHDPAPPAYVKQTLLNRLDNDIPWALVCLNKAFISLGVKTPLCLRVGLSAARSYALAEVLIHTRSPCPRGPYSVTSKQSAA